MNRFVITALGLIIFTGALAGEGLLTDEINQYRVSQGLSALINEQALEKTAANYIRELIDAGSLSHSDSRGGRVLDRYRAMEGTAARAGEILGSSPDLQTLIQAWKKSPSHNQIIMSSQWTRIGEAVVFVEGQYIAVVLFSSSHIEKIEKKQMSDGIDLSVFLIEGSQSSIGGRTPFTEQKINLFLEQQDLPLVLVLNTLSEGKTEPSDFIYLSDNF